MTFAIDTNRYTDFVNNWAEASSFWLAAAREDVAAGRDPFAPRVPDVRESVCA